MGFFQDIVNLLSPSRELVLEEAAEERLAKQVTTTDDENLSAKAGKGDEEEEEGASSEMKEVSALPTGAAAGSLENGAEVSEVADRNMSFAGHASLIVLFYAATIVLFTFVVIEWLQLPPKETNSISRTHNLRPVYIDVTVTCATPGLCGEIEIRQNYSFVVSSSASSSDHSMRKFEISKECLQASKTFPNISSGTKNQLVLCNVPEFAMSTTLTTDLLVPGVVVSFSNMTGDGIGEIVVEASEVGSMGPRVKTASVTGARMQKLLSVGAHMVKTANFGLYAEAVDGTVTTLAPYMINYQMEGSRRGTATDVVLKLQPFANRKDIVHDRSVIEVMGELGSAAETIQMLFVMIVPIWSILFAASVIKHGSKHF